MRRIRREIKKKDIHVDFTLNEQKIRACIKPSLIFFCTFCIIVLNALTHATKLSKHKTLTMCDVTVKGKVG